MEGLLCVGGSELHCLGAGRIVDLTAKAWRVVLEEPYREAWWPKSVCAWRFSTTGYCFHAPGWLLKERAYTAPTGIACAETASDLTADEIDARVRRERAALAPAVASASAPIAPASPALIPPPRPPRRDLRPMYDELARAVVAADAEPVAVHGILARLSPRMRRLVSIAYRLARAGNGEPFPLLRTPLAAHLGLQGRFPAVSAGHYVDILVQRGVLKIERNTRGRPTLYTLLASPLWTAPGDVPRRPAQERAARLGLRVLDGGRLRATTEETPRAQAARRRREREMFDDVDDDDGGGRSAHGADAPPATRVVSTRAVAHKKLTNPKRRSPMSEKNEKNETTKDETTREEARKTGTTVDDRVFARLGVCDEEDEKPDHQQ